MVISQHRDWPRAEIKSFLGLRLELSRAVFKLMFSPLGTALDRSATENPSDELLSIFHPSCFQSFKNQESRFQLTSQKIGLPLACGTARPAA